MEGELARLRSLRKQHKSIELQRRALDAKRRNSVQRPLLNRMLTVARPVLELAKAKYGYDPTLVRQHAAACLSSDAMLTLGVTIDQKTVRSALQRAAAFERGSKDAAIARWVAENRRLPDPLFLRSYYAALPRLLGLRLIGTRVFGRVVRTYEELLYAILTRKFQVAGSMTVAQAKTIAKIAYAGQESDGRNTAIFVLFVWQIISRDLRDAIAAAHRDA